MGLAESVDEVVCDADCVKLLVGTPLYVGDWVKDGVEESDLVSAPLPVPVAVPDEVMLRV